MNADAGVRPSRLSFSYGRALQDSALEAWGGCPSGVPAGHQALHQRARCNGAARRGTYSESMEGDARGAAMPAARARWSDMTAEITPPLSQWRLRHGGRCLRTRKAESARR